jgi:hypothetical protein
VRARARVPSVLVLLTRSRKILGTGARRLIRLSEEQDWRLIVTEMGIDTRTPTNFIRAQHLINQHPSAPETQPTLREADLANSHNQVVHALYVVAHATAVALTEYERDLQRLLEAGARRRQPLAERPTTLEVDSARGMIDRFDAIEQLLRTGSTPPTNLKPVKTDQPRASRTHWPPGSSKRTGHSPPTKTRPIWSESPACRHSSPPQPSLSAKLPGDEARSTRA